MNTPTPDYGEPWEEQSDDEIFSRNGDEGTLAIAQGCVRERIIACVNACAGMANPAKDIAELREAIKEARRFIRDIVKNHECSEYVDRDGEAVLEKLQPFIKP